MWRSQLPGGRSSPGRGRAPWQVAIAVFALSLVRCSGEVRQPPVTVDHTTVLEASVRRELSASTLQAALEDWGRAHGAIVSKSVALAPPTMKFGGLVATAPLEEGEVLVQVPSDLHLSATVAEQTSPVATQVAEMPGLQSPDAPLAAFLAQELQENLQGAAGLWSLYFEKLNRLDFAGMPVSQPEDEIGKLYPSPLFSTVHQAREDFAHDYEAMRELVGFDLSMYIKANLITSTRMHYSRDGDVLVPLADMFNHVSTPSAHWSYDAGAMLSVRAARAISEGEEITISYGGRSNSDLLITFGFTIPPHLEPLMSFTIRPALESKELPVILDRTGGDGLGINVNKHDGKTLLITDINGGLFEGWNAAHPDQKVEVGDRIFDVNGVQGSVQKLAAECKRKGILKVKLRREEVAKVPGPPTPGSNYDAFKVKLSSESVGSDFPGDNMGFLEAYVRYYMALYEKDPSLETFLRTWALNREEDPRSIVWWASLQDCPAEPPEAIPCPAGEDERSCSDRRRASGVDLSQELANGSYWYTNVIRAKMGEYVCLMAHAQVLDVLAGLRTVEQSIAPVEMLSFMVRTELESKQR